MFNSTMENWKPSVSFFKTKSDWTKVEKEQEYLNAFSKWRICKEEGNVPDYPPVWNDPKKFERGQNFVRKLFELDRELSSN